MATVTDQPARHTHPGVLCSADWCGLDVPRRYCEACGEALHFVTDTDNGEPWQGWMHDRAVDEYFCETGRKG